MQPQMRRCIWNLGQVLTEVLYSIWAPGTLRERPHFNIRLRGVQDSMQPGIGGMGVQGTPGVKNPDEQDTGIFKVPQLVLQV